MRAKYARLAASPASRLQATCPIHATWDDHDYGATTPAPTTRRRRSRSRCSSTSSGTQGLAAAQRGRLLARGVRPRASGCRSSCSTPATSAARSRRGSPGAGRGPYVPNTDPAATMLGEDQWRWLEEQLKHAGRGAADRVGDPGRARGARLGDVGELPAGARAALPADPGHRGQRGGVPERRPAPGRDLDAGRRGRLPALRRDVERAEPGGEVVARRGRTSTGSPRWPTATTSA